MSVGVVCCGAPTVCPTCGRPESPGGIWRRATGSVGGLVAAFAPGETCVRAVVCACMSVPVVCACGVCLSGAGGREGGHQEGLRLPRGDPASPLIPFFPLKSWSCQFLEKVL